MAFHVGNKNFRGRLFCLNHAAVDERLSPSNELYCDRRWLFLGIETAFTVHILCLHTFGILAYDSLFYSVELWRHTHFLVAQGIKILPAVTKSIYVVKLRRVHTLVFFLQAEATLSETDAVVADDHPTRLD